MGLEELNRIVNLEVELKRTKEQLAAAEAARDRLEALYRKERNCHWFYRKAGQWWTPGDLEIFKEETKAALAAAKEGK